MEHPITVDDDGVISRYQGPIARYLSSSAGRAKLAQSMAMPLRTRLDYQGIARKALLVEPLPQGALPTYDRDIDVSTVITDDDDKTSLKHDFICVDKDGGIGRYKTPGVIPSLPYQGIARRVTVPEFEIVSNPSIKISEVKKRRFNVIDMAFRKREVIIDSEGQITAGPK